MARLLVLFTLLVVTACTSTGERATSRTPGDPPLAGRIWDVKARRFVDADAAIARLARGRFVLLGEQHDNAEHHRLQARIVQALAAAGRRPAVAFEMLNADQSAALASYLAGHPRDGAGLGEAVDWAHSGWPEWSMYQPIADAAIAAGLPIVAANLSNSATRAMRQQGLAALDPAMVARVGLQQPLSDDDRRALADEIRESHCGYAPAGMLEGMITVQRARDGHMADVLARAGDRDGAVLIAGAGHVRDDWGVPAYLARRAPGAEILTVSFIETTTGRNDPTAYATRFSNRLPFTYLWFTPPVDESDPCEKFKRSLERMRQRPQ